jgi:hypothetical protein
MLGNLANVVLQRGRTDEALSLFADALDRAGDLADPWLAGGLLEGAAAAVERLGGDAAATRWKRRVLGYRLMRSTTHGRKAPISRSRTRSTTRSQNSPPSALEPPQPPPLHRRMILISLLLPSAAAEPSTSHVVFGAACTCKPIEPRFVNRSVPGCTVSAPRTSRTRAPRVAPAGAGTELARPSSRGGLSRCPRSASIPSAISTACPSSCSARARAARAASRWTPTGGDTSFTSGSTSPRSSPMRSS